MPPTPCQVGPTCPGPCQAEPAEVLGGRDPKAARRRRAACNAYWTSLRAMAPQSILSYPACSQFLLSYPELDTLR